MIQETKLKPNEKISCAASSDYQIYYLYRQESQGGGLALGVVNELESTLIREGNDETEVISDQIVVNELPVRTVLGYGPQENAAKEKRIHFGSILRKKLYRLSLRNLACYFKWTEICMLDLSWLKMILMCRIRMVKCLWSFWIEILH